MHFPVHDRAPVIQTGDTTTIQEVTRTIHLKFLLAKENSNEHYFWMSSILFHPFSPDHQLAQISRSKLPHWTRTHATHFVTFRLHDSIPQQALADWNSKRNKWLHLHGINDLGTQTLSKLTPEHRREYRRLFGKAFENHLDKGHGSCLLRQPENARIIANALKYFDGERYALGDFVIMPNHVHVLVVPFEDFPLRKISKSWKGFTARTINERLGQTGSLWQRESFDHLVRNRRQLERLIDYIAENPKTAQLSQDEFIHSQAEWRFE